MNETTKASGTTPAFAGRHEPRPLPFDPAKLTAMSERLIRSHWENNYCGSVKALNAVEHRLAAMLDDPDLRPTCTATSNARNSFGPARRDDDDQDGRK